MELQSYSRFQANYRAIEADRPRAADGHIFRLFREMFPDTPLHEDWTVHDAYLVISYHLFFNDLKKEGKPIGEKVRANFKAAKVMLTDLERGKEMLNASTKAIHKVLNLSLKEQEMKANSKAAAATKTDSAFPVAKKADKPEQKKFIGIRDAIDPLLLERKWTDAQIAAKIAPMCRKPYGPDMVAKMRTELNGGKHEKFPAPKIPVVEIGGDKVKAEPKAKAAPVASKKAAAPVAKAPVKAAVAAPVKKAAPVAAPVVKKVLKKVA